MSVRVLQSISLVAVLALLLGFIGATPASAGLGPNANPDPVQFYYVSLPEGDALTVLKAVNNAAVTPTHTYFSISIASGGTWVYYDHFEDGYEADITNPTDDTTEIWGNGIAADGCAPNKSGVPVDCTDANDVLNAGDVIVPYNAVPIPVPSTVSARKYVLDEFGSRNYSNNNGNVNWAGDWVEQNDSGASQSPTAGRIQITTGGQLRFTASNVDDAIDRGVNLSNPGSCATLSFDLGQGNFNAAGQLAVEVSQDGTNYTTLQTFNSSSNPGGSKSYNIASSAGANTRVRFRVVTAGSGNNRYWSVDNVRVEWDCNYLFNARDKVAATKSIAMARATWASGSDTLNAFAHELYATAEWGTNYEAPVGFNTSSTIAGSMFTYSGLSIMASQNNTSVQVDRDANGSYESSYTLNEGQAILVGGATSSTATMQGTAVQSDKPVQVVLVTGQVNSSYASRDMSLLPTTTYGSSYWSPVGTNSGNTSNPTRLFLYNPSFNSSIYVTCERRGVANVILGPVAARGVVTTDLANNQGARCFASDASGNPTDDKISGVATIDTPGITADWSFTMYPDNFLTTDALVGLGLGRDPNSNTNPTENGSPLWVTAACPTAGSTYVYVDWNNDGTPDKIDLNGNGNATDTNVDGINEATSDQGILVTRLQSVRLFRPTPNNLPYAQTGARIWSRTTSGAGYGGTAGCNLALAWGQDTRTASGGAPGLDVGTSVPPLRLVESSKSLTLKTDNDGDGQLSPGDVATYLITVKNAGPTTVNNVYVYDTVPANTTYVQNTTGWATAVGGPWTAIADAPNPGDLPLSQAPNGVSLGSLASNNSFFVRFDVTLGTGAYGEINNCSVADTDAGNLTRCAISPVASMDWGDLPDSYGTSAAADGARHSRSTLRLGSLWDAEYQGQVSADAKGDDNDIAKTVHQPDDEDGVSRPAWSSPNNATFQVTVTGGNACLNAWMDFTNGTAIGGDGDFGDALGGYSEHIIVNAPVTMGTQSVAFQTPAGVVGANTSYYYARFRLSPRDANGGCSAAIASTGFVSGGEVEDYRFEVSPLGVTLVSFEAMCVGGQPDIRWETASELTTLGFNVWRNTADSGPQDKLNGSLIAAHPGSAQGYLYSYLDTTAAENTPYYYWLEDIDTGNVSNFTGPISALCQAPTAVTLETIEANPVAGAPMGALPAAGLAVLALAGTVAWRKRR